MCIKVFGKKKGAKIAKDDCKGGECGVVNIQIKPGRYKCTHYYGTKKCDRDNYSNAQLFTKYEWVGEI